MSAVYAFISFGLYGAAMDPASGEVQLVARCKAIGVNVMGSPYQWSDIQLIVDQIMGLSLGVKIAVGGELLGYSIDQAHTALNGLGPSTADSTY